MAAETASTEDSILSGRVVEQHDDDDDEDWDAAAEQDALEEEDLMVVCVCVFTILVLDYSIR